MLLPAFFPFVFSGALMYEFSYAIIDPQMIGIAAEVLHLLFFFLNKEHVLAWTHGM